MALREPRQRAPLFAFSVAVLVQAWILRLGFQADDYVLLADPQGLFHSLRTARSAQGADISSLRWTLWSYWAVLRALSPEPLAAVVFLLPNLLMHGACAALLARVLMLCPGLPGGSTSAALAGAFFGLAAGGLQAVSFPSAGADLLFPLCGLLALRALLVARASGGRPAFRQRSAAYVWLMLALLAKLPALILLPVFALVLWRAAPRPNRGPGAQRGRFGEWHAEAVVLAAAALAYLGLRWVWLGHLELREGSVSVAAQRSVLEWIAGSAQALGQALLPWDTSPAFADVRPFSAQHVLLPLKLSAAAGASLLLVPPLALLAFAYPKLRGPLLLALACAGLAALQAGALWQGYADNRASRAAYFALLPVSAGVGMACGTAWSERRALGALAAAWFGALLLDGSVHVARTELLADAQRTELAGVVRAQVPRPALVDEEGRLPDEEEASRSPRPLALVLAIGDALGIGSSPRHSAGTLPRAFEPPFARAGGIAVRVAADVPELIERMPEWLAGGRPVVLLGPERGLLTGSAPALEGPANREHVQVRAWTELRAGLMGASAAANPGSPWVLARQTADTWRWSSSPPLAAHAQAGIELRFGPGPAAHVELALLRGERDERHVLGLAASNETRTALFTFEQDLEALFGEPWTGLELRGGVAPLAAPTSAAWDEKAWSSLLVRALDDSQGAFGSARAPPSPPDSMLEARWIAPPEGAPISFASASAPLVVEIEFPPQDAEPALARIELAVELGEHALRLASELTIDTARDRKGDELRLSPREWRVLGLDGHAATQALSNDVLAELIAARGKSAGAALAGRWRVLVHGSPGLLLARTPWRALRLR